MQFSKKDIELNGLNLKMRKIKTITFNLTSEKNKSNNDIIAAKYDIQSYIYIYFKIITIIKLSKNIALR